jgi:predicted exporter
VHGITLAFGFTLIGVAIDYPLHLFSHAQNTQGITAIRRIWPTLRLGAISTAVAYLALAFSASDGLAQLGVFSASGVITAVLVTRYWLPFLISNGVADLDTGSGPSLRVTPVFWPALIVIVLVLATAKYALQGEFWDDNVASLSPVPAARLRTDGILRSAAGSSEMRYLILLRNESFDELLQHTERLDEFLSAAASDGTIESWQSLTNLLPSSAVMQSRYASIPDRDSLRTLVADSIASTPFRANAFDPFIDTAAALGKIPELSAERFINSPLQPWLDAHLMKIGSTWVSLISLSNPDVDALQANSGDWGQGAELLDMRDSSMDMMQDYRSNAIAAVSLAAVLIFGILWMQRRNLRQVVWIVTTVSVALAATILSVALIHGQLTVVHLVALLLVAGLGLDYALFFSRQESAAERKHTIRAVMACAISTTLAFAILATSSIPVLKFMGLTVAIGSLASYLLAAASFRPVKRQPSTTGAENS